MDSKRVGVADLVQTAACEIKIKAEKFTTEFDIFRSDLGLRSFYEIIEKKFWDEFNKNWAREGNEVHDWLLQWRRGEEAKAAVVGWQQE